MGGSASKETEKDNFCRFGQGIVGTSSAILRDILESYVPHTELLRTVNNRPAPLSLDKHQRELVMKAATEGYKEFDITLLYIILRNLCSNLRDSSTPDLPPPSQNWGKEPKPTDLTLSDDIERIRLLRNEVFAHLPRAEFSETDYKKYWGQLKDVCHRCKNNIRLQQFGHDYEQQLKDLEKYTMADKDIKDFMDQLDDMQDKWNKVVEQQQKQNETVDNIQTNQLVQEQRLAEMRGEQEVHGQHLLQMRKQQADQGHQMSKLSDEQHAYGEQMCRMEDRLQQIQGGHSSQAISDIAEEQGHLTELYKDVTDCIPVLLEDPEGMSVSEIYAPLLIKEDLDAMKRTRRPDEPSGSKTLKSVQGVFYVRDRDGGEKLSTRIMIKGEAGSGKSVFCLKLVENWCQLRRPGKCDHVCEKHSELIRQLEKDHELPELLYQLCSSRPRRLPDIPCTACEMKQCLSEFDLLYYVPLRDATNGKTSVLDLVCDSVCNKRQRFISRTKHLLDRDDIRCLIVLDGVDEWANPPRFTGLPNSDGLSMKCVLLWTMRPWKLVHLQLKPKHDDHIVTVSGLSPYSVAKVIENILIRFYGLKGEELKSRFVAYCKKVRDKTLAGIMRMPMMLIAACHLWHKEEAISSNKSLDSEKSFSKTHLYLSLLDLMIQNAARKQTKQGSTEQDLTVALLNDIENNPSTHLGLPEIFKTYHLISHFIDMLLPFCELAFTDLMSAETKLVFNKGQLESKLDKSKVDLAHRLGLISQAKVRSDIGRPQNVSVSFYHKSVQELLAAMFMTCGSRDTVTLFYGYCSTLGKVMETANVTMFVAGLDPSLCSRICEHITNIVNSDSGIREYRRTLRGGDWVAHLYNTQCEWYRELTHNRTVTGDTSPPPTLHITDIYLYGNSDSNTVRLTGDLMSVNLGTIVSVMLWDVDPPLHGVTQLLPQCPHLSALCTTYMSNKENRDLLVSVIPRLPQLTTVQYVGVRSDGADCTAVAAVMSLTQLVRVELWNVRLGDDVLEGTDAMTRLRTVVLRDLGMTTAAWDRFVTSLLSLPHSLYVELRGTSIDEGTVQRIKTSPRVKDTQDDGERFEGRYNRLDFTTVPSQTATVGDVGQLTV